MSIYDYKELQRIAAQDYSFAVLVMAAMRKADTLNAAALKTAFPEIWAELKARYSAPNGLLLDERREGFGGEG